ncbi:cytochrome P450 [Striga asiatica]|uniref:Cytochrome P450 n=1 Tax=Striga asiatica TaxID=4170 RepID=A0A5A7Q3J1_STRAF|nr:cytochrome P450 [Striga asiatica]
MLTPPQPNAMMLSEFTKTIDVLLSMSTTLIASLCSLLLILLYSLTHSKFGPARRQAYPVPTSYPIIGCLISFSRNRRRLLDWYTDMLSTSPSQTIIISRFGAHRTIVTANPENVKYVLKKNFANFPKGKPFTEILGDFLGKGIFNVDGDTWLAQRKLVVHHFNAKPLKDYTESILKEEVEKKLVPVLESAAEECKTLDLQDLLRRLAFDLVCKVSLGYDPCCLEYKSLDKPHPIVEALDLASDMSARRNAAPISAMWKCKRFLGLGSEKRLKEAVGRIHLFIDEIIHERKIKHQSRDFESDLLSKMVLDGEEDGIIRDTMISFIMAGRDTTSSAMTWLFYLLSCHPDVENEVVKELGLVEKDGDYCENLLKYEDLKEMRWLKACICESMRLFPPVAWDSKHANIDDVLPDGTRVRAGDRVTYFQYGMGRMRSLWGEDWMEFKPDRWISDNEHGRIKALKNVSPYKFPVFQAGPRACPGKEMAFVQMKYVVASILNRFVIRPVSQEKPVFVPLLTAHMARGFKVLVQRRKQ